MPPTSIKITKSSLPDGGKSQMIFPETGFFKQVINGEPANLPSPAEVRACAQGPINCERPAPVAFHSLGLLVKYGPSLTTSEAHCLWAVGRHLKGRTPVPELYGWRRDGKDLFIYMELVRGQSLEKRWASLTSMERQEVCTQLRSMIQSLRTLEQDPEHQFIGMYRCFKFCDSCLFHCRQFCWRKDHRYII